MNPAQPVDGPDRRRPTRCATNHAFTLVELLIALALSGLVILLVLALSYTVSRALTDRQTRRTGPDAAWQALDQMARDLGNSFPVAGYEQGGFELSTEESARGPLSQLAFCSAERPVSEEDPRWFNLYHITYRLDVTPRPPGRLIRTRQPLAGPGALQPPEETVCAENIARFTVTVFQHGNWTNNWSTTSTEKGPAAAMITLYPYQPKTDTEPYTLRVLIPSGLELHPTHYDDTNES